LFQTLTTVCVPVEVAAETAGAGLSSFLADAGSYLRAAALDSRFALDNLGLLDLAECLDSALPDCLQSDQGSNEAGARERHLSDVHPLCFYIPLPVFKDCRPSTARHSSRLQASSAQGWSFCVWFAHTIPLLVYCKLSLHSEAPFAPASTFCAVRGYRKFAEWHKAYLRDVAVACESCPGCCLSSAPLEGSTCIPSPCCCRKLARTAAVAVLLLLCCDFSVLLLLLCTFAALLLVLCSVAAAVMLVLKAGLGRRGGRSGGVMPGG